MAHEFHICCDHEYHSHNEEFRNYRIWTRRFLLMLASVLYGTKYGFA